MHYRLDFYVPESHAEAVKSAIFAAGAGGIGDYDFCCWQTSGTGQFRPLPGSNPFLGRQEVIEQAPEVKIEVLCPGECLKNVLAALKEAHPYETPAFQYWRVRTD